MIPLVAPLIAACEPLYPPRVATPDAVVLGKPYDPQNPFAKFVRHEGVKPTVIYEDKTVLVFLDYKPASPGHALVISKVSKARNVLEMPDAVLIHLLHVARQVGRAEISGLGADGFTILQNNAYSQGVPHLHVHVIPHFLGYNPCVESGKLQNEATLAPVAARIHDAMLADNGKGMPAKPADDIAPPATPPPTWMIAVGVDPKTGADRPPAMSAFQFESHGSKLNAVIYTAEGPGPHPTLLLFHGFPGNEQNLDLAQAVRRAGWNVMTLHYRGSWGSEGAFSFGHVMEDGTAAIDYLRSPEARARFGVDPRRIAVAGHNMGGMVAAYTVARDSDALGTVLIDAWDLAAEGRSLTDPAKKRVFIEGELRDDLPPLSGTSEAALVSELAAAPPALDLIATVPAIAPRPLLVIGAEKAGAPTAKAVAAAVQKAGGQKVDFVTMPTDHSFSDRRIQLEATIIDWLNKLQ
jgi:diadenosine tetraphosphate (Ap4A) HIT family hydrolase/pimeloyl-ACP methyl ester carboxylesterase